MEREALTIGVDTNVLLRLFRKDDEMQFLRARAFFEQAERVHICSLVVTELVWVLDRTFDYTQEQISAVLTTLLDAGGVVVEQDAIVRKHLAQPLDIPDALIADRNAAAGCVSTVTFDIRATRRIETMEPLS